MTHGVSIFAGDVPWKLVAACVYAGLLVAGCIADVMRRRVPNALTAALALTGLAFSTLALPGARGALSGIGGLFVGLGLWLPWWLLRLVGAGDVKFYAAAGAWLGARGAFEGALLAAFAGGLLALFWMLRYRGLRGTGTTLWVASMQPRLAFGGEHVRVAQAPSLPYSVALAVGAALAAWYPHLLF
jgi:prepilin peptidase CpaA